VLKAYVYDVSRLVSILSRKKILNFLKLKYSYFYSVITGNIVHKGAPAYVSVEPTTFCNLKCPECFTSQPSFTRPKGSLSIEKFQGIMNQTSEYGFYLNLYFQGEPFMNPDIIDFIRMAKRSGFYIAVSTNGHFLNETVAENLIQSGLDRLIVSLDGTDAATYNAYRKNGDFEKVISGIQNMVAFKKRKKSMHPFIELQFVLTKKNQHHQKEIKQLGKRLGVNQVKIKSFQLLNFNKADEWLPDENTRYKTGKNGAVSINSKLPNRCSRMWNSCVLTWDGNVVPCCFDKNASYTMGNVLYHDFDEIWASKSYDIFRRKVFSERKNIDICRNCSEGL
jgi:radical SAM protein with 4Fe4S-binding SPASM domain